MNATLARLTRLAADLAREPDGRLLDAFLGGSQPAFRELVTRHGRLVFAVCRRVLGHRQDAEDAFQAAFLVLARRAADVWPRDAVGSWLYGVAYQVALKARSVRARRLTREQPLDDMARPPCPAPEPDLGEVIDRAVRRLPEVYRAAVVACDLEGLSRAEAAERLGWKEGTLSGRLSRARKLLADRLRRAGLTAPAGGLAVALGADAPVRAGLVEGAVELVSGDAAGGVSAPIAALTEGVVTSMFALKLKAAAVLVACSLGVGAWAAGAGDGPKTVPGPDGKTVPVPPAAKPADPPPDLTKALDELARVERELAAVVSQMVADRPTDPEGVARRIDQLKSRLEVAQKLADRARQEYEKAVPARGGGPPPPKAPTGLELLQGKWRVETIRQALTGAHAFLGDFAELEVAGARASMRYKDGGDAGRYTITVDDTASPRAIDLVTGDWANKGIYEFVAPAVACASCHSDGKAAGLVPLNNKTGLCGPGALKLATATPGVVEVRLGFASPNYDRPRKFGADESVIEYRLTRVATDPKDDEAVRERVLMNNEVRAAQQAVEIASFQLQHAEHAREVAERQLAAAKAKAEAARKPDPPAGKDWVVEGVNLTPSLKLREYMYSELQLLLREEQQRNWRAGSVEEYGEQLARIGNRLHVLQQLSTRTQRAFDTEKERAKSAPKKPAAEPGRDEPAFTVHVRPQLAAEKVIRVKATGSETVLEGLAYAAEDMGLKPDGLSVWVVRDKAVLPVDLAAITQKGDAKTNYALKAGDQLFVQVKVGK